MNATKRARRALALYLGLTFATTYAIQAWIFALGGPIADHSWKVLAMMWTPAIVSIACRLVLREGLRDVSFRLGAQKARTYLVAWLFPVAVGLIAYGGAWLSGLETFAPPPRSDLGLEDMAAIPRLFVSIGLALTLVTALSAISATGEEIGWRGYMLTRLVDAGVPHPVIASGLIWGAWHLPLILSGQYASGPAPVLSAAMFLVSIVGGGIVSGYVRLSTGSVWPAALFHAAWNAVIQGPFDGFTRGGGASRSTSIWIGEGGILVALVCLALAVLVVRRGTDVRRHPGDAPVHLPLRAL